MALTLSCLVCCQQTHSDDSSNTNQNLERVDSKLTNWDCDCHLEADTFSYKGLAIGSPIKSHILNQLETSPPTDSISRIVRTWVLAQGGTFTGEKVPGISYWRARKPNEWTAFGIPLSELEVITFQGAVYSITLRMEGVRDEVLWRIRQRLAPKCCLTTKGSPSLSFEAAGDQLRIISSTYRGSNSPKGDETIVRAWDEQLQAEADSVRQLYREKRGKRIANDF